MFSHSELNFRRTPVTLTIMAIVVALELVCTLDPDRRDFFYMDMKLGMLSLIWSGEIWRPFTSTLLHGNLLHAAFSVYLCLIFGQVLESRMGPWRYLGLFVLLGYLSMLPQFLWSNLDTPLDGQISCVGLSGIIYGLFGILWAGRRWRSEFYWVCDDRTVHFLVFWFFLCIVITQWNLYPVANVAHGAGLLFGWMFGMVIYRPDQRGLWNTLTCVASILVLATLIACPGHGLYEQHKNLLK